MSSAAATRRMCSCASCASGAVWRCTAKAPATTANFSVFKEPACRCAPCRFGRPHKCKAKRLAAGGNAAGGNAAAAAAGAGGKAPVAAAPAPKPSEPKKTSYDLIQEAYELDLDANMAKYSGDIETERDLRAKAAKLKLEAHTLGAIERVRARWEAEDEGYDEHEYDPYDNPYDQEDMDRETAELVEDAWEHYDTCRSSAAKERALRRILWAYANDSSWQRLLLDKGHRESTERHIRNSAGRGWFIESTSLIKREEDPLHVPHDATFASARAVNQGLYKSFFSTLRSFEPAAATPAAEPKGV